MRKEPHQSLSRRERQIMDILYKLGRATAADVQERMPGAPSYSTVRAKLRVLEEKGHARHEELGLRYVFIPTLAVEKARKTALKHLLDTFFDGSAEQVMTALLDGDDTRLSKTQLDRLSALIEQAKKEGA